MIETATITVKIADPTALTQLARLFARWADAAERDRHARLAREADRIEYAGSHALLRAELARATGLDPGALSFAAGAQGKPALALRDAPHFNLGHSRGWSIVAVSREGPVGVDIEVEPAGFDPVPLVASIAAPGEDFAACGERGTLAAQLLRAWVAKEAAVKLTGEGLGCDPRQLRVDGGGALEHVSDLRCAGAPPLAAIRRLDCAGGYAAVAVDPARAAELAGMAVVMETGEAAVRLWSG